MPSCSLGLTISHACCKQRSNAASRSLTSPERAPRWSLWNGRLNEISEVGRLMKYEVQQVSSLLDASTQPNFTRELWFQPTLVFESKIYEAGKGLRNFPASAPIRKNIFLQYNGIPRTPPLHQHDQHHTEIIYTPPPISPIKGQGKLISNKGAFMWQWLDQ